ncbi:MAG TPA: hypothetical protein VM695_02825 [Phycisphaerae bacterium]|nr:hypothetical protein [Phycisphaerae bacterium]
MSTSTPAKLATAPALLVLAAGLSVWEDAAMAAEPIRLHPDNPHYFLWRGKPTVLITSGEHYGAVLNRDFDYAKYLAALQKLGFNLTRTFSGAYCEPVGAFGIRDNTLAPARDKLLCPWARSDTPGYPNGGNKFDLAKWDEQYFRRLRDFVGQAARRGVVVEMVLFCPFYKDEMWALSPMNAANNVNGVGKIQRTNAYTLSSGKLLAVQEAMVRKVVAELKDFDNLYYEICNEPYFGGVTIPWQHHVADTIVDAEKAFAPGRRHLIAQNIANGSKKVTDPHPAVSLFNFHYATPPKAVEVNFGLNKALGDDETGFKGSGDDPYRMEGWDFLLAGGAVYDNLDYSFTCGHEDGTAKNKAPGGGGASLHRQLGILAEFVNGLDFVKMRPDNAVIAGGVPEKATARALVEPGRQYAVYVRGGSRADLKLVLPKGRYKAEWVNTKTGRVDKAETFAHDGGPRVVGSPKYEADVALRIGRTGGP